MKDSMRNYLMLAGCCMTIAGFYFLITSRIYFGGFIILGLSLFLFGLIYPNGDLWTALKKLSEDDQGEDKDG